MGMSKTTKICCQMNDLMDIDVYKARDVLRDVFSDIDCLLNDMAMRQFKNLKFEHRISLFHALLTARTILETAGMDKS